MSGTAKAYVDGSFDPATGMIGCGVIFIDEETGKTTTMMRSTTDPEYAKLRNVAGEVMGAIEAISYAFRKQYENLIVYYDYQGIKAWPDHEWQSNNKITTEYCNYVTHIRAHMDITFKHVKAHTGIDGNEQADKLAKKATKGVIK